MVLRLLLLRQCEKILCYVIHGILRQAQYDMEPHI